MKNYQYKVVGALVYTNEDGTETAYNGEAEFFPNLSDAKQAAERMIFNYSTPSGRVEKFRGGKETKGEDWRQGWKAWNGSKDEHGEVHIYKSYFVD